METEFENIHFYNKSEKTMKDFNSKLWSDIMKWSLDFCFDRLSFKEKFYVFEKKIIDLPKCECGNDLKFLDMNRGFRNFCSKRCMLDSKLVKDKRRITSLEKWGVENPSQNEKIKKKTKQTNLEKFGFDSPLKSPIIKEKLQNYNLEKWGVDNPSKLKSVRKKAEQTNIQRWGVKHASQNLEIKEKVKSHFLNKFGQENPSMIPEIRERAYKTNIEKYGVKHALQNEEIKNKMKKTNIKKFGFEYSLQNENIKQKQKETNLRNWGVDNYAKTEECKLKVKNTNLINWGVDNYAKTEECKNKIRQKNIEKCGENHLYKSEEFRKSKFDIANHKDYIRYIGKGFSEFCCDSGHNFILNIDLFISRKKSNLPLCTLCNPVDDTSSIKEKQLFEFIVSIYGGQIIRGYRDKLEIDIYLPELQIGFEFNGLYWHSQNFKEKNYHSHKTKYFNSKGIKIIHIWEDDWTFKREILESQIKNWLKVIKNKIYARNCHVQVIDSVTNFFENNHIQGLIGSKIKLGLFFENELVSSMLFDQYEGRNRMKDDEWNLTRFCNKLNFVVVGAASKLLKYFIDNYQPKRIISYSDQNWSMGDIYYTLGFSKIKELNPDYQYILNERRVHKSNFKKNESNVRLPKIWDCGKLKFEMLL